MFSSFQDNVNRKDKTDDQVVDTKMCNGFQDQSLVARDHFEVRQDREDTD